MSSRFFIGNLSRETTERELSDFFVARHVSSRQVSIVINRATGLSRGFGFVEFDGADEADTAMRLLQDVSFADRRLVLRNVEERLDIFPRVSTARSESVRGRQP